MIFPPHGDYEIHQLGMVLLVRLIGTWNVERYREYLQTVGRTVTEMGESPRAVVFDLRSWGMGSLDIFDDQRRRVEDPDRYLAHLKVRTVQITSSGFMRSFFQELEQGAPDQYKSTYVDTPAEALAILAAEGFDFDIERFREICGDETP
jgi:hypothetical protein